MRNITYCRYTDTFRYMPQNYWMASVKEGRLMFDSWDGCSKNLFKSNPLLYIIIWWKFLNLKQ